MKLFRVFYTFAIVLFVFIGNIGINIFTHSCQEEGDFHSVIIKVKHGCDQEEKAKPSCCKEDSQEKGCCSDEVSFFKVQFNFFQTNDILISYFAIVEKNVSFFLEKGNFTKELKIQRNSLRSPPPKPSGQELLLLNQVFRI